jgi:steroid 5-alpha reductase family enzyme
MDEVIGISVLVIFLALKIVLMRAVWKMAKAQGRSQWICLIASVFAALIVFLALWISGRERTHWEQLDTENARPGEESKSAVE